MHGNMNIVDAWKLAASSATHALHTEIFGKYPLDPNWETEKVN